MIVLNMKYFPHIYMFYTMFMLSLPKMNSFSYEHNRRKILYCCEALKILYTMKKVLLLEPLWENYEALNFSNTFPTEKPFNYNPLKLMSWHKARQVLCLNVPLIITIILCMRTIVNIKHGFPSCCFKFLVHSWTIMFFIGVKTPLHIQHKH